MIIFDNVSKFFGDENKVALNGINLTIEDGEFVFVSGHSGCGKTTMLRLLLREYQPDEGEIYYGPDNLRKLSLGKVAQHRRKVGVVFQDYQLLDDLTVWENIALPIIIAKQDKKEIAKRIAELLELLGLTGYGQLFPTQLSGGEAQRVSLARALAIAPEVIFADEPTGNLDDKNSHEIVDLLKSVNEFGTTVVFATHNLDLIKRVPSARLLTLKNGVVINDTAPKRSKKEEKKDTEEKNKKREGKV
jgi:cell division transport system ATP-binding protein